MGDMSRLGLGDVEMEGGFGRMDSGRLAGGVTSFCFCSDACGFISG